MKQFALLLSLTLLCFSSTISAQNHTDVEQHKDYQAVHTAVLDYVEGLYLADSTRIMQSVHPELRKRGYWFHPRENGFRDNLDMTYQQLVDLSKTWNSKGDKVTKDSPKLIEIYDINSKTASAKLTAEWGIDYFHLAKLDEKWYIMNVLWQSITD